MKYLYYVLGALAILEVLDIVCFAPKFGIYRKQIPAIRRKLGITYYSPTVDRIATKIGLV